MGIWEFVSSKADTVKRNVPDATPVKNTCRNSYNLSSAAFAKIDQTVRTISVRRFARWRPVDDILAKEVETDRPLLDANSMKNGCTSSCGYGYGLITFSKIGYTVRVKGIYRIVRWMKNDGTKSMTGIYATNFARNAELHESKDIVQFIPDQAFPMPVEKECMNSYTFGFISFFRIGRVVRVNVYRFGQWMADDDTKSRMSMYSTLFAKKACRNVLQDCDNLVHGGVGVALFLVLSKTLIDTIREYQKQEQFCGDLKDEAGFFSAIKEILIFVVNGFTAFVKEETYRSEFRCKGVVTMDRLAFIVRESLVFTMKRCFGTELRQIDEMVGAIMRALFGTQFVNDFEFREKKGRKKRGKQISW